MPIEYDGGWFDLGRWTVGAPYTVSIDDGTNAWIWSTNTSSSMTTTNTYTINWTNTTTSASTLRNQINDALWTPRRAEPVAAQPSREARSMARATARSRADELLVSMLNDQQRESYRLTGEFEVMGSSGNLYRVCRGTSGNVLWVKPDGQIGARLCAHPEMRGGWLPDQDVALAQLLALVTDEPAFIRMANVHAGVRPPLPVPA